ncbi:hypothetical protein IMSAGC011_02420 [Lachnospiraceae bacterium]|nr:hypothetical protein IMSAGC011_02420 [Lachnospiraceae bacterium]
MDSKNTEGDLLCFFMHMEEERQYGAKAVRVRRGK